MLWLSSGVASENILVRILSYKSDNLTIPHDVSKEVHLGVLLGQLEGLVYAVADHQELDGGGEVAELDEEPGHHLGSLGAPGLLHDSHRVLWVVQFVQVEPNS